MNIDDKEEIAKEETKEKKVHHDEKKDESQNLLNKKHFRYKVMIII